MKTIKIIPIFLLSLWALTSCEKNNNDSPALTGMWINSSNSDEFVYFIDDKKVTVNGHDYIYEISSDSIYFQYNGPLFVLCLVSGHKFQLDNVNQKLNIENMNELCLVNGNTGNTEYIRETLPNNFIGEWVTTDFIDTFIFVTNSRMETPRGNFNNWYKYSYTNDSLTFQYNGPNKIYVKPLTTKYEFRNDTLIINLGKDYYPDIKKGLKNFLKQK